MAKTPAPRKKSPPEKIQLFTLEVNIINGPMTDAFAQENPIVSRTFLIRGDQTLDDLHEAIFEAFDREEDHMYQFQVGGMGPMDAKARTYERPDLFDEDLPEDKPSGDALTTRLDSLRLKVGKPFGYWFDFGDDWWHQINVIAIEEGVPKGKYPKVVERVGDSPPQYMDWTEEEED